ncbi:MAG: double zinc ribbon domain-containing protein [Syntrophorhabdaceae bacterium]|nr:double zinc ribbon domain-containing protein [Syntrophorhabdaceae bacterium]
MAGGSTSTVLSFFNSALSLFYPQSCGVCGADGKVLCEMCTKEFLVIKDADVCQVCDRWLGRSIVCGPCSESKMWFGRGFFIFEYDSAVREVIHAFKFEGCKKIGRQLVNLVSGKFHGLDRDVDVVIPVPVSGKRLREKDFNQSYIIAEEIAAITGLTIEHSVLVKRDSIRDQFSLPRDERKKNIKGAFRVEDLQYIKGRRILLVDDPFTTGYTASEAARTLVQEGSAGVILFALARTP